MSEENNDTQQVVYIFTTNITPINLVIAAAFVLFASYKMLFHRSGPAAGLTAAFDGLLWLMVRGVGLLIDLWEAMGRSLAAIAVGNL
jgi:hypothetical protein